MGKDGEGEAQPVFRDKTARRARQHLDRALSEIFDDMVRAGLKYGIVTCANVWYLVRRPSPDSLQISDPISWSASEVQPTVIAAILWVVHKAESDWTIPSRPPRDIKEDMQEDEESEADFENKRRAAVEGGKVQDFPEGHLHLADRDPIALGWSGTVNLGEIGGQPAAIKLAPRGGRRGKALLTEAGNYLKLRELWGKRVPRMLSFGTTCGGKVIFLATELLSGEELTQLPEEMTTIEIASKAKRALRAVHAAGLLHGYVNPSNFFIVDRGEACPDVFILDFGFSRPVESQEECAKEMKMLQRIL